MQPSLRTRLVLLWLMMVIICLALAALLWSTWRQGAGFQIDAGQQAAGQACAAIQREYGRYAEAPDAAARPRADLLYVLLELTLRDAPGIEGGVWSQGQGFIAYAYPTYEGSAVKRDVPEAEKPRIARLARQSVERGQPMFDVQRGQREASIVAACPLAGPMALAAWTLKRVPADLAGIYDHLALGLGVLLVFVLASGAWLVVVFQRWSRHLARMEQALARHNLDHLPRLAPTGERDLDRIVAALNQFGDRLRAALDQSSQLTARLAQADRLAALGRMTAGVAHEIRNPIAAMRLKAENALAQPGTRQGAALQAILAQIERLDKLLQSMLAMTQPLALQLAPVAVPAWLEQHVQALREPAQKAAVEISFASSVNTWVFDPLQLGRALDNLLWNALQHTPPGETIDIAAEQREHSLLIRVTDSGPGIAPAVKAHIFEPFASGRAGGTGLGLPLTREILIAHGGDARFIDSERGTCFELELPWRAS